MDTTSVYELRDRLRAAAMAGTNLLSEDFRLRRAYKAFQPLEKASPVFAKIGQLTGQLLAPECQNAQGTLLDTIALADAVICTLGTVDVAGEVGPADALKAAENAGSPIINAPYSALKTLLEALTTPGGGHYNTVCEMHENRPELFNDYRVKYTLVQALGASYAELADQAGRWIIEENDKTFLPVLYRDFDPKGKKEMVRRVKIISALAGAGANDFYVKMLKDAQKEVRTELIGALRYELGNIPLLFELSKTEKGKNKDKVFEILAEIQREEVYDFFREQAKKKPENALKYLRNLTAEWAAELVVDLFHKMCEKLDTIDSASDKEQQALSDRLQAVMRAVFGKGGAQICDCYRQMLAQKDTINDLLKKTWKKPQGAYEHDMLQYGVLTPCMYWYKTDGPDIETALGKVLHHSLIVNPDPDLQALAMELYTNGNSGKTNVKFLAAAVTVKFSGAEDCTDWLTQQVADDSPLLAKYSKERVKAVAEAANYVIWDKKTNSYKLHGSYVDTYYTDYKYFERPVELPHAKAIINWMKQFGTLWETDNIRAQWVPLNDEALCREMGELFYQKALADPDLGLIEWLKDFGWTNCQGLGVSMVKKNPTIQAWYLYSWLIKLPGSKDAIMEEMQAVCQMKKEKQWKALSMSTIELKNYMEQWYMEQKFQEAQD